MLYNDVELFNIEEIEPAHNGVLLFRFPKKLCDSLGSKGVDRGRFVSTTPSGVEIRFVSDGSFVTASFMLLDSDGLVSIFYGDHQVSVHSMQCGVLHCLRLERPEQFTKIPKEHFADSRFTPGVWRICFNSGYRIVWGGIEAYGYNVRPPMADEKPSVSWLAYGSSITMGAGSYVNTNAYIAHSAKLLSVDVMNKGLGGACRCEEAMGDYLASVSFDICTLELGVNMYRTNTTPEFENLACSLVDKIATAHPQAPILMTTIFPNFVKLGSCGNDQFRRLEQSYNTVIESIANRHSNIHLIDGGQVLDDISYLSHDLIHPSDYGHVRMGENLAAILKSYLPKG